MNIKSPGVYKSDGTVMCIDCKRQLPEGELFAVGMVGLAICNVDQCKHEYRNAMREIGVYTQIKNGRPVFDNALVRFVKANMKNWEDK